MLLCYCDRYIYYFPYRLVNHRCAAVRNCVCRRYGLPRYLVNFGVLIIMMVYFISSRSPLCIAIFVGDVQCLEGFQIRPSIFVVVYFVNSVLWLVVLKRTVLYVGNILGSVTTPPPDLSPGNWNELMTNLLNRGLYAYGLKPCITPVESHFLINSREEYPHPEMILFLVLNYIVEGC